MKAIRKIFYVLLGFVFSSCGSAFMQGMYGGLGNYGGYYGMPIYTTNTQTLPFFSYSQAMQQLNEMTKNVENSIKNAPVVVPQNSAPIVTSPVTSSSSSSTSGGSTEKTQHKCYACNGTGRIEKGMYVGGSTPDKWCNECNKKVYAGHYHTSCSACHGKGYDVY